MDGWMEEDLINKKRKKKVYAVSCLLLLQPTSPHLIADAARNRDLPILMLQSNRIEGGKRKKNSTSAKEGNPIRPAHRPSNCSFRPKLGGESRGAREESRR